MKIQLPRPITYEIIEDVLDGGWIPDGGIRMGVCAYEEYCKNTNSEPMDSQAAIDACKVPNPNKQDHTFMLIHNTNGGKVPVYTCYADPQACFLEVADKNVQ